MAKYRHKPRTVEAFFLGKNTSEFPGWWREARDSRQITMHQNKKGKIWYTFEYVPGTTNILHTERYIVLTDSGNIYSCQESLFERLYEKVDER